MAIGTEDRGADGALPEDRIRSYAAFWPYYLAEHKQPGTRVLHFVGTGLSLLCICLLLATGRGIFFPAALIAGYGFAWVSHFAIEHNRPATFRYPLWSLISDYRMFFLALAGRLAQSYSAYGLRDN